MDKIRLSDHFTYKRIFRFTLPSIGMMIFVSIYGAVDGLFVSNFVGTTAFAALNLIMPFIMVLSAFGFMIGSGGSAIIGKTLGEGKQQMARKYFSFFIWITIAFGSLLGILGAIFMKDVALLLGAEGELLELSVIYGNISMISMPAFMLQCAFQNFFITAEKPGLGFLVTIVAGCSNMVLDGFFIVVMDMGLAGAAWGTITSEFIASTIGVIFFVRNRSGDLWIVKTKFYGRELMKACTNGVSELVSNIAMSFISMVYNFQLIAYAGEDGVAAYGVLMYVSFLFSAIYFGYGVGIAPVISYSFGAQNHGELKNIFRKSITIMSVCGVVLTAVSLIASRWVCYIFVGYDEDLLDLTVRAYRIYTLTYIFMGVGTFGSSFFTALNNGIISAIISGMRTFVFRLSAIMLLPLAFGLDGIWLSTCVAEVLAFCIVLYFFVTRRKRYKYA